MASHRRLVKHFSRKSGPRKALLKGLMNSLVEHGRIKTTVVRAKEVKRHIEKAVTLGKKNNLNSIRLLIARLSNQESALNIVNNIAPKFSNRLGGYTRVIKIGRRPGDSAEMAFLEFVDFDWSKQNSTETDSAALVKQNNATKKEKAVKIAVKKKSVRKMKNSSRSEMFAIK